MTPQDSPRHGDWIASMPLSDRIFDKLFWPDGRPARDVTSPPADQPDQSATVAE